MVTFKITLHLCQWTLCGRNKHLWEHRMQFIRIDTCFKLLIRSNSKVFDRILQVLHLFPSYWAAFLPWMAAAEKLSAVSLQWRLLEGAPGPWVSSAAGVEALQDGAGQDTRGALTTTWAGASFWHLWFGKEKLLLWKQQTCVTCPFVCPAQNVGMDTLQSSRTMRLLAVSS